MRLSSALPARSTLPKNGGYYYIIYTLELHYVHYVLLRIYYVQNGAYRIVYIPRR